MMKFFKSPLGIALTAVSAILIASPEARKITRRLAVKGTAAVLGLADQIKDASTGVRNQLGSVIEEARQGLPPEIPTHNETAEHQPDLSIKDSFNVLSDEALNDVLNPTH